MMKSNILKTIVVALCLTVTVPAQPGEFSLWKAASAGIKTYKAMTLSDSDVTAYVKESVKYMDKANKVLPESSPYTARLKKLTANFKKVNGVPLNFKVYKTNEYNAFACADGSVRVYSGLMDVMTDNELLGVIGHEIGHVGLHHSRKQIRQELLNGALRDIIASSDSKLGMLADSQLGAIGESMLNAKYSRNQEKEADDYGYKFLKNNGKNPWALVMAFEKLNSMEKKSSAMSRYVSKMFSSHPAMEERISRLKDRCKKEGIKRPS